MTGANTGTGTRAGRPRSAAVDDAILDATVEELIAHGFPGLRMEGVAARAGVAKTTLYRRWDNPNELVFAALEQLKWPVLRPPGESLRADLVYVLDRMRRTWEDPRHGAVMRRLAADGSESPEHYRAFRSRLVEPRHQVLREILRGGIERGELRADTDVDLALQVLTAPTVAAVLTHQPVPSRAALGAIIDTVLRGLAP